MSDNHVDDLENDADNQTQPNLLNKFTDATSAIVELVILIIEKLGFYIPERAKNEIGIILLLIPIYVSGGLFKTNLTLPMVLFGSIFSYTFLDVLSANYSKISRFLRGKTKAENIILKIKEGHISNSYEEISYTNFDAESIDKLLIELSNDGLLTYDIQKAIVDKKRLYPKNIRTIFNENSLINLNEDIILRVLSKNYIKQSLTKEVIQNILDNYKHNKKIVAILLLNQKLSIEIVKNSNDESLNHLLSIHNEYVKSPLLTDKYFNTIAKIIKTIMFAIYIFIFITSIKVVSKSGLTEDGGIFLLTVSLFVWFVILINIYYATYNLFVKHSTNKKISKIFTVDIDKITTQTD